MDFSALIAELRNIASSYNGRDIDSNVSTAMYCEMFRKILQKAESEVAAYDDQIVILWMTLSQLCQTYKTLTKCKERNDLYQHIFLLCAKVVLNIKWQQLADDDQSKQNFRKTVEATHSQLVHAGFDRFGLLLNIMENPWTDPTITKIMSGDGEEESNSDTEEDENEMSDERKQELEERKKKKIQEREEEFAKYISSADPLILRLRVEMLMQENCEEWALNLCSCCLRQRRYQMDLEFKAMELLLLFKLGNMEKLQEACETIECHHGIYIIEKLEKKESNQSLCVRLIQTFLVQDWIRPDRNCCTKKLLQMWIKYQSMEDKDRDKFLDSVWAIAKISSSTDQVNQLVTGLVKKCGLHLLQLYTDLCVYAINFDKGCCEQQMIQGNMEGVKKQQWAISNTCIKLADLYCNCNPKLARIAALTAFSLNPSIQNFNVVRKTFVDKRKEKMQALKEDSTEEKGKETPQKTNKPRQSKYLQKVNPATIHEVERLLNMLRPYYLDPEMGFEKLQPMCQKFMDERGGGISEPPKKPSRPPSKANLSRQNSNTSHEESAGLSRPKSATPKLKNAPITSQSPPAATSTALPKTPLFGNKPHSYRAMSQSDGVPKPRKVQSNVVNQRLVPAIQPQLAPLTKTTAVDSTSNISELLKATKTLPQYNPNSSPSASLSSYTSSSSASVPQRPGGVNVQQQSSDLLRRHSVNLPINATVSRSEVIGDAGDKSIYQHLYKPLKTQEPTNLKTAKPPSNKLQITNVNKFTGQSNSYNLGGQANLPSIDALNRPAETMGFPTASAGGVDQRRPSAEELQSIVDWLQSGTEDAVSKQSAASFNPLNQQTPPPAHSQQMSFPARGQGGPNSQARLVPAAQKVDLNTLLTQPQVVANALKIQPKGKTAVQEAASQISQRLTDIRRNSDSAAGDAQLLLNLQKSASRKPVCPPCTHNTGQPVPGNSGVEKNLQKNLTDKDLSLEEMKRRIADIVQRQRLLCESKPDQPAKRRRSASPKGKKQTGSASSTPTKGLNQTSSAPAKGLNQKSSTSSKSLNQTVIPSPLAAATVTLESCNPTAQPAADEVQKQQIQEWFNNRRQVQQQIEKLKQHPQTSSNLSKPQFILQQQAAPVQFVTAEQIENLHSNSAQRTSESPRVGQSQTEHAAIAQKPGDQYNQRLGFLPRPSQGTPSKFSLLEQKLLLDDNGAAASTQDTKILNSFSQSLNRNQPRMLQGTAVEGFPQEGRLPTQRQLPPHSSQGNPNGVAYGNFNAEGKPSSSDESTPTTLLSVLLEQSKYINSVAATSASSKPSQNESLASSQASANVQPFSTVSNPVLTSMVSTANSASPIRNSAQQTLSFLLPQTAHCGRQDVISNSNSPSTSSNAENRKTFKDSPKPSPVGFQLQYVGQIKTKEIPSVAECRADLLGGHKSGLGLNKSAQGVKLLTCYDNDVMKEITKMIDGEKKQPRLSADLPFQPKPQQLGENKNMNSRIPSNSESLIYSAQDKGELNSVTIPNEKPPLLTNLNSHGKSDDLVKNQRQFVIDSLENGIKQSMEQIDVSAELLENSPKKRYPQNLNGEQKAQCSESFKDLSSVKSAVMSPIDTEGALVETSKKTEKSAESQNSADETKELGAYNEGLSPHYSTDQPLVTTQQVESLATENVSASEMEKISEKLQEQTVVEAFVEQKTSANPPSSEETADEIPQRSVPEDEADRQTLAEAEDTENGASAEEQSEGKGVVPDKEDSDNIPDHMQSTFDTNNVLNPEASQVLEKMVEVSESMEKAVRNENTIELSVNEEQVNVKEMVPDDELSSGIEKQLTVKQETRVLDDTAEEKEQESVIKDSESAVTEDQNKEDRTSTEQGANWDSKEIPSEPKAEIPIENKAKIPTEPKAEISSEPRSDILEEEHAETKEEKGEIKSKESVCMEDIKLDNIDRSKVIHKLKSDMNNLLHQIEDLNGGDGSRTIGETLEDIKCLEPCKKDENSQITILSDNIQKLEEELESERLKKGNKDAGQDNNECQKTEAPESIQKEEDEEPEKGVTEKSETVEESVIEDMESESTDAKEEETQEKEEDKEKSLSNISVAAEVEPKPNEETPVAPEETKDGVSVNKMEAKDDAEVKKEEGEKDKDRVAEKETEVVEVMEEGNRKLDKFRKNQKRKKSDIPVNFGFDFNEESNAEEKNEDKKPSSEESTSKESEMIKVSPHEPRHRKLQGSAILKTRKKYRENLQGAQEMAEKIKEHIISGTKVVEITEKTSLTSVVESKAVSAEVKKNMASSNRVSDPDIDTHSVSSNSSSSSIPSMNQLPTSQPNTEKEKGVKEVSDKINKCLICGKEFRSVLSLKEHVKNMCKPTDFVRTKDYEFSSRFTCSKCGMTSSSSADMKRHMKKQHSLIDEKDFEDLLISNYRCEMCGEAFKDKMAIYSHVSASCPQLESTKRKEFKMFVNDKRIVKNVPNLGNLNRGKLVSATVNQHPQHSRSSRGKFPVCKNEGQKQVKTVEIYTKRVEEDSKAEEVNKKQETDAHPSQETVSSQSGTSSSEPKVEVSPQPEEDHVESQTSEEPPVVNQRVTRSKLEKKSSGTGSGKNHTKETQRQEVVERSRKKSMEDQKKGKVSVEDACKKLNFRGSPNRTVVKEEGNKKEKKEEENKKEQVMEKDTSKSVEKKKLNKQASDEQSKTPSVKRHLRTRNSSLSPNTTANVENKEDRLSSPPDQGKSKPSTPSCTRLTRSKGAVENVDYNDLEKVEMNSRKSHTRHHSGSTDVSMLSDSSEVEQQQQFKSPEQCNKKKSQEDSCELAGSSSVSDDVDSGQEAKGNSQRKRKEPASGHPEVPTRGKRLIKVKKYDQYEVPEFLKSQVNNSNKKRQSNSETSSEKVTQNPASTKSVSPKKETRKCSRCGKQFANQTKLIKHIASVHLSPCKPSASSRCSYQCRYCKATYKSYSQFLNHVPGHSTQILEGLESTQIVPAVVHSKPVQVKDTEVTESTEEEKGQTEEEIAEKDKKVHSTQQSENKSKKEKEQTESTIATRSRRSTAPTDSEQSETVKSKSKLNLNSNTEEAKQSALSEENTLTTRSRSRSGRCLDKKEEKLDEEKSSSSRQLRSSGGYGGGKGGDLSKKKSSSAVSQNASPQVNSELKTRSNLKRKSEHAKSPAPAKKSKEDQSESTECETSEFELAGSDAEISFRKRLRRKRKVQVDFINTCDSDIEELEEDAAKDDKDYSPGDDHEEEDDENEEELVTMVKRIKDGDMEKVDDDNDDDDDDDDDNEVTKKKNQEKVSVAVAEDDEFEYVKSPTHETTFNEGVKNLADTKEKIVLSRSSKDHSAYLNSYMSYIDNQNKRTRNLKERSEKVLQQNSKKKTIATKKPRPTGDTTKETLKRETEAEKDNKGITAPVNQTPVNQTPTSFLDSFLEHCSKADGNNQNSPAVDSAKGEETREGEDQSNERKTKSNQIQDTGENGQNVEVKEGSESENSNAKLTEACDKGSINAFQDTFKSFVTAGSNKGDISGDSPAQKESLSDVIEGLADSERARRAGSEDSTHTVSSRCTDISDTSETAQVGPKSNKRMRHIYHNGKIWHVGAGNVTSMSVKLDSEGQAVTNSTLPGPVTPGLTLATKQLIRVDRDKNTPHQDEGDNTYTYTTAEELKREAQANASKWRKREKTPLSIRK